MKIGLDLISPIVVGILIGLGFDKIFSNNSSISIFSKNNNIVIWNGNILHCEHNKRKSRCVNCEGVEICIHKRVKYRCVDCEGAGICIHKKIKQLQSNSPNQIQIFPNRSEFNPTCQIVEIA